MTAEPLRADAGDDNRHRVAMYRSDDELVDVVSDWFRAGLQRRESLLMIATEAHRHAVRAAIQDALDPGAAVAAQQLTMVDARATLATFMIGGAPDAELFEATVGGMIRQALGRGRGVCAFGEMVTLLWQDGDPNAALALEAMWNDLQTRYEFSLLCAYPNHLVTDRGPEGYVSVNAVHSSLVAGPPVAADAEVIQQYPAHAGSPRLARRFVRTTLDAWGLSQLSDDASLVVTELATNAVRHARSDFALSIARSSHGIRLAIGDTATTSPTPRKSARSGSGRGLHLVAASAREWGHLPLANGKLVWAEIDLPAHGDAP